MQVLQAGRHKLILLEIEAEAVAEVARQAGFESRMRDNERSIQMDLVALNRNSPLLLFDASDPANLGWFSRCQFYVDGLSGTVLQTPIQLANQRDVPYQSLLKVFLAERLEREKARRLAV